MNSIGEECQELKVAYDECFNRWIRDSFLQGKNDNSCDKLFETYQACVKKVLKEKGIEPLELERDVLGTEDEKVPPDSGKK